jgi:hypothetical protein
VRCVGGWERRSQAGALVEVAAAAAAAAAARGRMRRRGESPSFTRTRVGTTLGDTDDERGATRCGLFELAEWHHGQKRRGAARYTQERQRHFREADTRRERPPGSCRYARAAGRGESHLGIISLLLDIFRAGIRAGGI